MKIIEAIKQFKDIAKKQEDLRGKVALYCSHLSVETPLYGAETRDTVRGWLQAHEDLSQESARLKLAVQRTNLETKVTIQLGGKSVTKVIAEWILRRGGKQTPGLANADREAWAKLGDRNLREGMGKTSQDGIIEVKIVRNFDVQTRDQKIELYRSEPGLIDAALEVANAVTDLLES